MHSLSSIPRSLITLVCLFLVPRALAEPASLPFTDCFDPDNGNVTQKIDISTVYAQIGRDESFNKYLNLTVIGTAPQDIQGFTNKSSSLATLFTSTSVLTLNAWSNSSYFCLDIRPPSPLPTLDNPNLTYCPIAAGPFALGSTIPVGNHRSLTTLTTRLRAVDTFTSDLFCIDVATTPLHAKLGSPYGNAKIIFWSTVGLTIAYWVVVGIARIVSAWGRGITRHERGIWSRAQSAGYILASAISGERFATSPALLRFCTPSMRDIMFHTQWCSVLAMVAVNWPRFVYPLLTQTAWATLTYNTTLIPSSQTHHWDPLSTPPFSPPSNFADQIADSSSPLYLDPSIPNTLFMLPENATQGMASFAYTIGIRPQDLFPTCLILFLGIIAGTIVVSVFIWFIDHVACMIFSGSSSNFGPNAVPRLPGTRSPGFTSANKDTSDETAVASDETKSLNAQNTLGSGLFRPNSKFGLPLSTGPGGERGMRSWWRIRIDGGSFHVSVLYGNLVRILILFHLPVTIFSCYQMTMRRSDASLTSIALAGLSFALFSVIIPAALVLRVTLTTTNKLYDETRTLLSFGPLYNHYRHGSQMFACLFFATNLAFGVTVGAGQKSGTAQAIIILVVEVISALVTSVWLPWGAGASMGLISFLFCVARIVIAVLLVILTPTVSIDDGAGGWVAYGILIILALVYLALLLMLFIKMTEAFVRIIGGIGFDRSRHVVDSGLLGACGLLGCCGPRRNKRRHRQQKRPHNDPYKATELRSQHEHHDSDGSSYVPPAFPPPPGSGSPTARFMGSTDSRKGSTHSGPPPSVLKPEHAMRPYKEDEDDEGFIMGAWQRLPRSAGYVPVQNDVPSPVNAPKPSQSTSTVAQSGFSRVGGGRSHIDTPYAITSGSTHTFPSIGQQSQVLPPNILDDDDSPPPSLSNVPRHQQDYSALPPGAMQPSHIRTKSQTAIIEDASILASLHALTPTRVHQQQQAQQPQSLHPPSQPQQQLAESSSAGLRPPVITLPVSGDDDTEDEGRPKKKHWFRLGRNRAHSSENPSAPAAPAVPPIDEELGGIGAGSSTTQPTRSFVVIRKPQSTPGRLVQSASDSTRAANATT